MHIIRGSIERVDNPRELVRGGGDGSGSFRTRGQYSAATIRGTKWLVQDSCTSTLTRVSRGAVTVQDLVRHKTVIVRAGKRYTARAKRR